MPTSIIFSGYSYRRLRVTWLRENEELNILWSFNNSIVN